jgi:CDP-4-dehydro-6-deoxyglucose reductase
MPTGGAFQVRIEASGHTFTALPHETLLEAALRSGINVNYNCSNGTCGDCRVRLLDGKVQSDPADYRFNSLDKGMGYILLCRSYAASDLVIAAQEARVAADIPHQLISTKIAKVESGGEHIRILNLRTPRTKTLRFLAGQYVCLSLPEGSIEVAVASCPCNGMQLQFHLRRREGEPFIERIFEGSVNGQTVEVEGPFGEVTLDDESQRPLLMVAVNEELAPIKSLIEHAVNLDLSQPVRLFWLTGPEVGHYLENYCRSWGDALDDYGYTAMTIGGSEPDERELSKLVSALTAQVADFTQLDVYLAGPTRFQRRLGQQLLLSGVDGARLFLPSRFALNRQPSLQSADGV